jgi:hypothetical protein
MRKFVFWSSRVNRKVGGGLAMNGEHQSGPCATDNVIKGNQPMTPLQPKYESDKTMTDKQEMYLGQG